MGCTFSTCQLGSVLCGAVQNTLVDRLESVPGGQRGNVVWPSIIGYLGCLRIERARAESSFSDLTNRPDLVLRLFLRYRTIR